MEALRIRKAAVLGAGVMGAQIAAHLVNADVSVVLFDLAAADKPNAIVNKALDNLKKLKPAPLGNRERLSYIDAANYDQHLAQLADCDLVIEAIAEKMAWKEDLYKKIAPHLPAHAILASNTSGLSIAHLAEVVPTQLHSRFCGIHFFNPPRYMHLVELIPAPHTDGALLDALETWLTTHLGKGVVRALDTPNFVANRIGVAWLLVVAHHTAQLKLGFDTVDALTGSVIGLPKSATFRLLDVVGLDTLGHVIGSMQDALRDDPWHRYYAVPEWTQALIAKGALGQKSGAGLYRREGKRTLVLNLARGEYVEAAGAMDEEVATLLKAAKGKLTAHLFAQLRALGTQGNPQAQLLWAIHRDLFHYCATHLVNVAHNARDIDLAMRWGYGWARGPFEIWQAGGWSEIAALLREDLAAGLTLTEAPLPAWVDTVGKNGGVFSAEGAWSAAKSQMQGRSQLLVYRRQLLPDALPNEAVNRGRTVWENAAARLWLREDIDARIPILSITSKVHALGADVVAAVQEAVVRAEREFDALVFWQPAPFAVGADLKQVLELAAAGKFVELEEMVRTFQQTSCLLKYARVPVVTAIDGMALGGGCEFSLYAGSRVAAFESYIGLVEAGVGLIPAGGGCAHFAVQAARDAARYGNEDVFAFLSGAFMNIAQAKVSSSALDAQAMGFLQAADAIVFHARELPFVALQRARGLANAGWRAPLIPRAVKVAGRTGIANCEMILTNMRVGEFISDHDYRVARAAAVALCGGEVDTGTQVDEHWLLDVERTQFVELLKTPLTQARIKHTLETGKPLRN